MSTLKTNRPTPTNLRSYLLTSLGDAVSAAFPDHDQRLRIIIVKPRHCTHGDLSSPVAFELSRRTAKDASAVALELLQRFARDERYVVPESPVHTTIRHGFINFRISDTCLAETLQYAIGLPGNPSPVKGDGSLTRTIGLVRSIPALANDRFGSGEAVSVLTNPVEREILCLIAQIPGFHGDPNGISRSAARFYVRRIAEAFDSFYGSCPIYSSDKLLTLARMELTRAVGNVVCVLQSISETGKSAVNRS